MTKGHLDNSTHKPSDERVDNGVAHKPATPLPWSAIEGAPDHGIICFESTEDTEQTQVALTTRWPHAIPDADYIAHACNAYPRLVAALLALTETGHTPEDRERYMRKAHTVADDLLDELGEL